MFFESLIANRNYWVIVSFLAYLVEILVFARLYHNAYRAGANSFFTPEHLHEARRRESLEELAESIVSLEARISFLTALREALQKGTASMSPDLEGVKTVLPDGRAGLFRWFEDDEPHMAVAGPVAPAFLVVCDPSGSTIAQGFVEGAGQPPTETKDAVQYIAKHLQDLQCRLQTRIKRKLQLDSGSPAWSAFDFLYFSVITQTTVGYGDILPNCTKVREYVMVQVVVGLILLAVIINLTVAR